MSASQNLTGLAVLIADDCPVTRRLLTHYLKKQGYQVTITENGRECLTAALMHSYALVITDIDMPEMSGIECATRMRKVGLELPIIAITASSPDIVQKQCFAAGMNAFLTKPINFTELKRSMDQLVVEHTSSPFRL